MAPAMLWWPCNLGSYNGTPWSWMVRCMLASVSHCHGLTVSQCQSHNARSRFLCQYERYHACCSMPVSVNCPVVPCGCERRSGVVPTPLLALALPVALPQDHITTASVASLRRRRPLYAALTPLPYTHKGALPIPAPTHSCLWPMVCGPCLWRGFLCSHAHRSVPVKLLQLGPEHALHSPAWGSGSNSIGG
jgi:hypothetical protein